MNQENDYRISFFKPTTKRALDNRNLVIWLVSIWAIAVFGFHIVLRIIEKPTPEPELIAFNDVWPSVKAGSADAEQLQQFAISALHVTGKVFIKTEHRHALDNGITWATWQLADSAQKATLNSALQSFNETAQSESALTDTSYITAKNTLSENASRVLQLTPSHVLTNIVPFELKANMKDVFTDENKDMVESIMPMYLTHNRSVLTDITFLGFPFHYFYSAVFLLVLFIGLCYAYCVQIDKQNKKLQISE